MNTDEVVPPQPLATVTSSNMAASNPWTKLPSTSPQSLEEVMSEELAQQLSLENQTHITCEVEPPGDIFMDVNFPDTSNDTLLAQMMQREFDKEHDEKLKREENQFNGNSKVRMSFDRYRLADQDDQDDLEQEEPWEEDDSPEPLPNFSKRGIAGKEKDIITKHDPGISGRKNARHVMEKLDLATGDGGSFDMRLSNKVYNQLKKHSQSESKRSARLHDKTDRSTAENAMDENTRLILYKLVNNDVLESVNGTISSGKESVVYHADGGQNPEYRIPVECAAKIFKTSITDFKNRAQYMKGDIRFFKDEFKKQNPRRIMKLWASKEEYNLRRLAKSGIPCPQVVVRRKHVLLMSFIGKQRVAAPKLKNAKLSTAEMQMAYEQCLEHCKTMYDKAGLVHADLSEYNLLWQDDTLYVIDVGQAVEKNHPFSHQFLLRDCHNVCEFFTKQGIPNVPTKYELFNTITGLELRGTGEDFLAQVQEYEKSEEKLREDKGKDYSFEFFFDKAGKERDEASHRLSGDEEDSSEDSEEEWEEVKPRSKNKKTSPVSRSPKTNTALSSCNNKDYSSAQ